MGFQVVANFRSRRVPVALGVDDKIRAGNALLGIKGKRLKYQDVTAKSKFGKVKK